jgi:hypothetical protein
MIHELKEWMDAVIEFVIKQLTVNYLALRDIIEMMIDNFPDVMPQDIAVILAPVDFSYQAFTSAPFIIICAYLTNDVGSGLSQIDASQIIGTKMILKGYKPIWKSNYTSYANGSQIGCNTAMPGITPECYFHLLYPLINLIFLWK